MATQGSASNISMPTAVANQLSIASTSPPTPTPSPTFFRFLDLAPELQKKIISFVLVCGHPLEPMELLHFNLIVPVALYGHQGYHLFDDEGLLRDHLALTRTCKTLYTLSLNIYFGQNHFILRSPRYFDGTESTAIGFLSAIEKERRVCLTEVTFDLVDDRYWVERTLNLLAGCRNLKCLGIVLDPTTRQWSKKDTIDSLGLARLKKMRGLRDVRVIKDSTLFGRTGVEEKIAGRGRKPKNPLGDLAVLDTTELVECLKGYMCQDVVRSEK